MAQPAIVQHTAVASAAPAPANFTANFGGASVAGTLLVAFVCAALSGAPTIATPANWTAFPDSSGDLGTALAVRLYVLPNNPGGVTNAVFGTLVNVNAIAVALWELSDIDYANGNTFWADASSATLTVNPSTITTAQMRENLGNTIYLCISCCLTTSTITASTFVLMQSSLGVSVGPNGTISPTAGSTVDSAGGATNARLAAFSLINGPSQRILSDVWVFSQQFTGGNAMGVYAISIPSTNTTQRVRSTANGIPASFMASGYAGSTGGF